MAGSSPAPTASPPAAGRPSGGGAVNGGAAQSWAGAGYSEEYDENYLDQTHLAQANSNGDWAGYPGQGQDRDQGQTGGSFPSDQHFWAGPGEYSDPRSGLVYSEDPNYGEGYGPVDGRYQPGRGSYSPGRGSSGIGGHPKWAIWAVVAAVALVFTGGMGVWAYSKNKWPFDGSLGAAAVAPELGGPEKFTRLDGNQLFQSYQTGMGEAWRVDLPGVGDMALQAQQAPQAEWLGPFISTDGKVATLLAVDHRSGFWYGMSVDLDTGKPRWQKRLAGEKEPEEDHLVDWRPCLTTAWQNKIACRGQAVDIITGVVTKWEGGYWIPDHVVGQDIVGHDLAGKLSRRGPDQKIKWDLPLGVREELIENTPIGYFNCVFKDEKAICKIQHGDTDFALVDLGSGKSEKAPINLEGVRDKYSCFDLGLAHEYVGMSCGSGNSPFQVFDFAGKHLGTLPGDQYGDAKGVIDGKELDLFQVRIGHNKKVNVEWTRHLFDDWETRYDYANDSNKLSAQATDDAKKGVWKADSHIPRTMWQASGGYLFAILPVSKNADAAAPVLDGATMTPAGVPLFKGDYSAPGSMEPLDLQLVFLPPLLGNASEAALAKLYVDPAIPSGQAKPGFVWNPGGQVIRGWPTDSALGSVSLVPRIQSTGAGASGSGSSGSGGNAGNSDGSDPAIQSTPFPGNAGGFTNKPGDDQPISKYDFCNATWRFYDDSGKEIQRKYTNCRSTSIGGHYYEVDPQALYFADMNGDGDKDVIVKNKYLPDTPGADKPSYAYFVWVWDRAQGTVHQAGQFGLNRVCPGNNDELSIKNNIIHHEATKFGAQCQVRDKFSKDYQVTGQTLAEK